MSTTITQKGQVTIPKVVRDMLGLFPGLKVSFKVEGDRAYLAPGDLPKETLERWRGIGNKRKFKFKNIDDYLKSTRGRS